MNTEKIIGIEGQKYERKRKIKVVFFYFLMLALALLSSAF